MRTLFITLITLALFTSCSKYGSDTVYAISGYIYSASDSTPVANKRLVLNFKRNRSGIFPDQGDDQSLRFNTDENGYFSLNSKIIRGGTGDESICKDAREDGRGIDCQQISIHAKSASSIDYGIIYLKDF